MARKLTYSGGEDYENTFARIESDRGRASGMHDRIRTKPRLLFGLSEALGFSFIKNFYAIL